MKNIIICIALLVLSTISYSQQTSHTKVDYLQKSKNQKTTGLILAGGGVVLEIAGIIAYQYGNASIFLFGTGLLSQVASIPFLISARVNKKRAKQASVSLRLENIPNTQLARMPFRSTPEIALRINL